MIAVSDLATVTPIKREPFWTSKDEDGTTPQAFYNFSNTQRTCRRWIPSANEGKGGKKVLPFHLEDFDWKVGAGNDEWPLFQPVPIEGFEDKWLAETEGEKCARLLAEAGFASISQPGCKHSEPLIVNRYADLKGKVKAVVYLADNDKVGRDKAAKCARAAASVGLPFVVIHMSDLFPDLPEGGSIDDLKDVPAAMQKIAEAVPSQLPAQFDCDGEPDPIPDIDVEEPPAQQPAKAELPQGQDRAAFTWERLVPNEEVRNALTWVQEPLTTDPLAAVMIFLTAVSGVLKLGTNVSPTVGWVMPVAIWLMVVAKTGRGKSPAFENLAEQPLDRIADDFAKSFKAEKAHYDAIKNKAEKPPQEPRQYFAHLQKYNPATMDRQLEWHEERGLPLLALLDEIEGLFKSLDRDEASGSGDGITQLLSLFNGRGSNTIRMGGNRCFRRAHFAICGFIQPNKLLRRINGEDDDGRHARFVQIQLPKGVMRCRRGAIDTETIKLEKHHRKVLSDLVWEMHLLPAKTYSIAVKDGAQKVFCNWTEAWWEKADQPTTKPILAALYNKLPDHAAKLSAVLHLVNEYVPGGGNWKPSSTIPLAVIELALAIIDCLVAETERFYANEDDLEAQAIAKFKTLSPTEWTWDSFKGKCKDPIRKEGKKLWTNIVTAMRDAGIGEVTKSKPLTFRRHTDTGRNHKVSA